MTSDLMNPDISQVSVKNSGSLYMDSKVSLEIPAQTVLAYSIIELEVKAHGKYGQYLSVLQ